MLADPASGKGLKASWFAGGLLLCLHKAVGVRVLKCKVKWVLGSIPTNKARGGAGIPFELF